MYIHYLKAAFKRILAHRLYSLISILSLATGMTTALLIVSFLRYETSFDANFADNERIYRLNWIHKASGARFATFYNPVSILLAANMPEIEAVARLGLREHRVSVGDTDVFASVGMVDSDFFRVLSYPTLAGEPDSVIREAGSAVLTEAAALRLFGTSRPLGEVFTIDGKYDFRVGAIVVNNPANSHLGVNIFVNNSNLEKVWGLPGLLAYSGSDTLYHYVKLAPGTDPAATTQNATRLLQQGGFPVDQIDLVLQPLRDIHFTTDLQNEAPLVDDMLGTAKSQRPRSDLLVFSAVGVMTLLIASLNFMNMQTVQFAKQAREVAVRRISGSSASMLTLQLLSESVLMALLALLLVLPLYELFMPYFSTMVGTAVGTEAIFTPGRLGLLALLAVMLGLLTGLHPAWTAARMPTVAALRGELLRGRSSARFRAVLVILQFTFSIALIIGSLVVRNQLNYALSKPLGFDPANVLSVELPDDAARDAYPTLKAELLQLIDVVSVSAGSTAPTRSLSDGVGLIPVGGDQERPFAARSVTVSEDYFETLGMKVVAGRAQSADFPADKKPLLSADNPIAQGGIVINEAAARQNGWNDPAQAIGQQFYETVPVQDGEWRNEYTIRGVVADAHYGSIRREVEPVIYFWNERLSSNVMLVKLASAGQGSVVTTLETLWKQLVPGSPLRYGFMSETYSGFYAGEARTFALFVALASLAILVACSGLYGLASWNTERRVKEIGVRKVMGSGVWNIVVLLTSDFSRLVVLSNLIAWPLAYVAMSRWLENFAYRIDITPLVFVGSATIAFCIAWVTVGGIAAKAASAKPVLALRYE